MSSDDYRVLENIGAHLGFPLATVGTFNIPSARTLRSVGLRYAFMTIEGRPGPFMVMPQPLGSPRKGETLYNNYPDWAMTKGILPRP